MPENFNIIRARIKDDAPVLIDRILRSSQKEVLLVLPKNSIIAANLDSLKILKQEAESVDKLIFIDTENPEIKDAAETLGMIMRRINYKIQEKTAKPKIKRMIDIIPPGIKTKKAPEILEEDLKIEETIPEEPNIFKQFNIETVSENNSELEKNLESFYLKTENAPIISQKNPLKFTIIFLAVAGVLSFLTAMYISLPRADIKISLKKIPLKASIPIAVSKNANSINLSGGIIPGQYFLLTKSGSKNIDEQKPILSKYSGFIDVYNAYSSAPQKLVAQTRFETKDGKIFRIQKTIMVPGAKVSGNNLTPSSIKVEIMAEQPGEEYNVGPSYFTIPGFKGSPKYAGFYAKSIEPMTGKTINTSLDKELLAKYQKELQDQLVEELKNDTVDTVKDSNLQLINGASTVKVDDFKIVGQTITMKITWQAIFFKETDFETLVNNFISSQNSDLKNFAISGISYPKANKVDFKKGELFFIFNIDQDNAVASDLNALKKELAGLDESGIRSLISSKNFVSSASISLWPFWVKESPNNPDKINITIDNQ